MNIKKIEAQPTEVKKLRVAAYCRVSTEQEDQKESLEAQREHYESWIRRTRNGNVQACSMISVGP